MNVIIASADRVARASNATARAGDILEQLDLDVLVDPAVTILCAEHKVEQDVGQ
jgi:hypothetical protein